MMEFRVHVPDRPGQLALVSEALSRKLVNIRSVAGVGAAGPVITFITDNDEQARGVLHELGLKFEEAEVLSVTLSDRPGELARVAHKLAKAGINVDSIHVLRAGTGETEVALTVSDPEGAMQVLGL